MLFTVPDCLSPPPDGFLGCNQTSQTLNNSRTPDAAAYNHKAAPTPCSLSDQKQKGHVTVVKS